MRRTPKERGRRVLQSTRLAGCLLAFAVCAPASRAVDPSARLPSGRSAWEYWDLIARLDTGHRITWRVLITVSEPAVQPELVISNGDLNLSGTDTTVQISATGGLEGLDITFASSNPDAASIDPITGLLTVQGAGTTTVTASKAGQSTAVITYLPVEVSIQVVISTATPTPPSAPGGTECVLDQSSFDDCTLL